MLNFRFRVQKAMEGCGGQQILSLLDEVLHVHGFSDSKLVLLSLDPPTEMAFAGELTAESAHLPENVLLLANAQLALNTILAQSLAECSDSAAHIIALVHFLRRTISVVSASDRLGHFPKAEQLEKAVERARNGVRGLGLGGFGIGKFLSFSFAFGTVRFIPLPGPQLCWLE